MRGPRLANPKAVQDMIQSPPDARALAHLLTPYREANTARGVFELVVTVVPLLVIWAVIWAALDRGYWIGLLLAVPAAGLLLRLFMIQHDCGHGSFFRGRRANEQCSSRKRFRIAHEFILDWPLEYCLSNLAEKSPCAKPALSNLYSGC